MVNTIRVDTIELIPNLDPTHAILEHIASALIHSLNLHVQLPCMSRNITFGLNLTLLPYFACASREGSGESAHVRRLA